jgi:hypothetical protein
VTVEMVERAAEVEELAIGHGFLSNPGAGPAPGLLEGEYKRRPFGDSSLMLGHRARLPGKVVIG